MVSIDEAIEKYKEITNTKAICPGHCNISCDKCLQESKQIAEWLEELKELREKNETLKALYEDVRKEGNNLLKRERNKAIDDLLEDANEMAIEVDVDTYTMKAIGIGLLENIAEQLKAGD